MANSVFDVAKYILLAILPYLKKEQISPPLLQRLLYYSQTWSLVWDKNLLFNERIEAWIGGPIIPVLFKGIGVIHKDIFLKGNESNLSDEQKETIDVVLKYYGHRDSQWLNDLVHMENPWKLARKGLLDTERGNNEITPISMQEYYGNL